MYHATALLSSNFTLLLWWRGGLTVLLLPLINSMSISINVILVVFVLVQLGFLSRVSEAFQPATSTVSNIHVRPTTNLSATSRRNALKIIATLPTFWVLQSDVSCAAKIKPDDAFASLVKARKELQTAGETYLPKRDWEGLRTFLDQDAINMNAYEANAGALLESKMLDAESKKDIGTIRRYGVGADVIIMYGGLKNEVDEENENPNGSEIGKYLRRTADSLDEVIAICRSNGF
eukprot:CAMPEP_0197726430 /NCGR_PEP_ID=MMETSP1434-20131217/15624_1 /TAXON_ID=265543 /ORGANISM="Minutocellus polymorphus, Strain CCMP3303" /LENGTH=233 /DNA_ID=CAMNT_0043312367 /DNA_START=25 /DNA_END=726 /DNA_ORIENTATION=-